MNSSRGMKAFFSGSFHVKSSRLSDFNKTSAYGAHILRKFLAPYTTDL